MKKFLEKIGLIQHVVIELKADKNEFVRKLRNNIDESDLGIGSSFFEVFKSSKNEFKGNVSPAGFKLRKRQKLFQRNMGMAIAKGAFRQNGDTLFIDTEINGFKKGLLVFYSFLILFYLFFITIMSSTNSEASFIFIPFIIIHATFMIFLPYYFTKKGVKSMKKDLEKEFIYFMNKNEN